MLQKPQLMEHIIFNIYWHARNLDELGVNAQDVMTDLQGADRGEIAISKSSA